MGNAISRLFYKGTAPVRDFNIQSRAEKAIMRDKPKPAPKHPVSPAVLNTMKTQEKLIKEKNIHAPDEHLLKHLKDVYVTSHGSEAKFPSNPSRPLPESREVSARPEYGYSLPVNIPYGKTSIKSALEFISQNKQEPEVWTAKKIAYEYKLDEGLTENILKYFQPFAVHLPETAEKDAKADVQSLIKSYSGKIAKPFQQLASGSKEPDKKLASEDPVGQLTSASVNPGLKPEKT